MSPLERLAPYMIMLEMFVRNPSEWYDAKTIRAKIGWNNQKIYTGLDVFVEYNLIVSKKIPIRSKASFYNYNSESDQCKLLSALYAKLRGEGLNT